MADGPVGLLRLVDGGAQRPRQTLAGHLQQVETCLTRRRLKVSARGSAELEDLQVGVDQDTGRGELVDGHAVGLALCAEFAHKRVGRVRRARPRRRRDAGRQFRPRRLAAGLFHRQVKRRNRPGLPRVDFLFLVHRFKQVGEGADGLGGPEEEKPVRPERVVERGQHLFLQARLKVDQHIAATDQIQAREGGIADDVLPGKHDGVAKRFDDPEPALFLGKKPPQTLRRDILRETFRIEPVAGLGQVCLVEIGREDLQPARTRRLFRTLGERHREGIGLLAGRTPEHPHAQRLVSALREQRWKHFALEQVKRVRIAEETGHADEGVGIQGVQLPGIAPQKVGVTRQRGLLVQDRAPGDAAMDRGGLVQGEIHPGMIPQEEQNLLIAVFLPPGRWAVRSRGGAVAARARRGNRAGDVGMAGDSREFLGDRLGREHEIDTPGPDGEARHRIVFGRPVLRKREAALGLDRLQADGAVGRGAGKNHPDGPLVPVLRQSFEKTVDRPRCHAARRARPQLQHAADKAQGRVGRDDVDVVGQHPEIVCDLDHGHRRGARQNLGQCARVIRVEMLHQDKGHARVGRQPFQQPREGLQAARRRRQWESPPRPTGRTPPAREGFPNSGGPAPAWS